MYINIYKCIMFITKNVEYNNKWVDNTNFVQEVNERLNFVCSQLSMVYCIEN